MTYEEQAIAWMIRWQHDDGVIPVTTETIEALTKLLEKKDD